MPAPLSLDIHLQVTQKRKEGGTIVTIAEELSISVPSNNRTLKLQNVTGSG